LGNHTKSPEGSLLSNLKVKTPLSYNYHYFFPHPQAWGRGIGYTHPRSNGFLTSIRTHHSSAGSNQLGYYLAGLIEGDGSIILRKGEKEKISPKIVFTFSVNELKMFEKLQEILKTGSINIEKEGVNRYASGAYVKKIGVCRYSITNADAVINIINLVNGKFRTPKIAALHKAIDNLNKWRNANLLRFPLDTSSLDSNAWLAGFIDSDGHFSIKLSGCYSSDDLETRGRVQCVFTASQSELNRVTAESNVPIMTKLAEFFQVNLNYKTEKSPNFKEPAKKVVFYAQSDRKHYIITSYLTKFPLMTSKYLNYLAFFKGLNYLGKRLTSEEILEVQALKNSMNNKRTEYVWDHLDNFYV